MSLTLRKDLGFTEAVITDDGSLHEFYQTADVLHRDLRISFLHKEDEFDSLSWGFKFKGHYLTLHYSIYTGISVFPTKNQGADDKQDKAVEDIGILLESRLAASRAVNGTVVGS